MTKAEKLERQREYAREYYQAHREEIREKARERGRKYYQAHREECIERCAKYRREHLEEGRERSRKYSREHPEEVKRSKRGFHLSKTYGLTLEDWDRLLASQGGECAICGRKLDEGGLCVDHDHTTGEVRGLLCSNCNVGIGSLQEDPDILRRAITYLERK